MKIPDFPAEVEPESPEIVVPSEFFLDIALRTGVSTCLEHPLRK